MDQVIDEVQTEQQDQGPQAVDEQQVTIKEVEESSGGYLSNFTRKYKDLSTNDEDQST